MGEPRDSQSTVRGDNFAEWLFQGGSRPDSGGIVIELGLSLRRRLCRRSRSVAQDRPVAREILLHFR
ncbi:hypothetical protein EVAR_95727_1 [Eumeta japonica]|uniref:Uncharacterized protein n=1 Tax=Eumeta variegata TaxID=151549 RepID=A0A4C1UKG4_EUMVA|nr:hypothetical protein EVAR_95727_1 [Eumeta japonica]